MSLYAEGEVGAEVSEDRRSRRSPCNVLPLRWGGYFLWAIFYMIRVTWHTCVGTVCTVALSRFFISFTAVYF